MSVQAVAPHVSEQLAARDFEPAAASYAPGELETSVAAATASRRRGCSGSPSELFAPATAGAAQLRRSWKRPAPAERSRRAERSRKSCERHARERAERPSFGAPAVAAYGNTTGGLWSDHEETE